MNKVLFEIYIAGPVLSNFSAISTFREVCAQQLVVGSYDIEIVDIIKNPSAAERKKILAIPTIIRDKPVPERRIIGDTKDPDKAIRALQFLMEGIRL